MTTTRIQKIQTLASRIENLTERQNAALAANKAGEANALASKIESLQAEKLGLELEIYEKYGITV
jgi:hypothetical protein